MPPHSIALDTLALAAVMDKLSQGSVWGKIEVSAHLSKRHPLGGVAMRGFYEILQDGNWRYGIAIERDAEGDGTWDWRAVRIPLVGSNDQLICQGKAESRAEAARLAEVSLQADQEQKRRCPVST